MANLLRIKKNLSLAALALLMAVSASASEVTLAWDHAGPSKATTSFILYGTTNASLVQSNLALAQIVVNCGTNKTVQAVNMTSGLWRWAVVTDEAGVRSDLSNVLPTEVPTAPGLVRTVALQYSFSLQTANTNWPTGMFIRIVP